MGYTGVFPPVLLSERVSTTINQPEHTMSKPHANLIDQVRVLEQRIAAQELLIEDLLDAFTNIVKSHRSTQPTKGTQ